MSSWTSDLRDWAMTNGPGGKSAVRVPSGVGSCVAPGPEESQREEAWMGAPAPVPGRSLRRQRGAHQPRGAPEPCRGGRREWSRSVRVKYTRGWRLVREKRACAISSITFPLMTSIDGLIWKI